MLREWIVTLHNREDLESFYNDMETPGGDLYIPDRQVEVANKRPISRNTHYMLTNEEAELVRNDPRVWDVTLKELVDISIRPLGRTISGGNFDKAWAGDATDTNWGLLRHTEVTNRTNWGDDAGKVSNVITNLTLTASGKNVDVVIVDGHIDPNHPEFAKNKDGSGGSRVVQYNWFQHRQQVENKTNSTYVYVPYVDSLDPNRTADNNHGCHAAGTVAGNTQGWAADSNIYNISPYSTNPNSFSSTFLWDYIRVWHNSKPINPETGRRNPTITNNSYGSIIPANKFNFGSVTAASYRGVTFSPGRALTAAELQARGFYAPTTDVEIPNYFTSIVADQQDAIDDGIIIVAAAGNESWKIVNASDQDYNNQYQIDYFGFPTTLFTNRGTGSGAGYAPIITVGAYGNNSTEDKASFSNCGSQVDIFAAGEAIQSSLHTLDNTPFGTNDPRNSSYKIGKYQGTSMASPQVAGVLALLAESWPNITQLEAQSWLTNNAATNQMLDTDTDNAMDTDSLQGAPNKLLLWINQRAESGSTFPQRNFKPRPFSGKLYPRPRLRRRG